MGGQREAATRDLSLVANRGLNRLRMTVNASSGGYDFAGGWAAEVMLVARLMPDSVLLPNGKVVILNGAKVISVDCTD